MKRPVGADPEAGPGARGRMMEKAKALRRVAYHEAGHAVVTAELRGRVVRVSIVPGEDFAGISIQPRLPKSFQPDAFVDGRTQLFAEKLVMICFAGVVSERMATGRAYSRRAYGDMRSCADVRDLVFGDERVGIAWERWLHLRTEHLLRLRWHLVEALAQALLERRVLKGKEVQAVLIDAWDPPEARAAREEEVAQLLKAAGLTEPQAHAEDLDSADRRPRTGGPEASTAGR